MFKNIFNRKSNVLRESNTIIPISENTGDIGDTEILEFMLEQEIYFGNAVLENTRYMYLGEKEDCIEIITESVQDFFDKMAEFFKKLLNKIKEFFGKLFLLIQSLLGKTDKIIKDNRHNLLKKDGSFVVDNYDYTVNGASVKTDVLDNLIAEYNKEYNQIHKMNIREIVERREQAMDTLPKLRGQILGNNERIESSQLREEANKFFRNGEDSPKQITVDKQYIAKICDEYSKLDNTYTECVKEKRKLEVQLDSLKRYFESGSRQVKYINGEQKTNVNQLELKDSGIRKTGESMNTTATSASLKAINAYFDYRFAESKELSNIILTVLDSKCKALRDEIKHYDDCIRKWLYLKPDTNDGKVDK